MVAPACPQRSEEEHYPIGPPDPIEAVKFRKEQMSRSRK
jgi:HTH-type transcriptional regulator/antitoxin HigA